jgi:hypothetical protein
MSFTQGAPTQPMSILASNVFLTGSSTAGNAFTVQQLGAGNVASFQTSTSSTSLIINPSGNVGIGKTNPGYALDVTGDINFTGTFRQNGSAYIGSQWTGTTSLYFVGNVGIGTTNPTGRLSVVTSGDASIGSSLPAWTSAYMTVGQASTTTSSCVALGYNATSNFGILYSLGPTVAWREMKYHAASHSFHVASDTPSVTITSGAIGIGTTTPASQLHLYSTNSSSSASPYTALTVMNTNSGLAGACVTIDLSAYNTVGYTPAARISALDNNYGADIIFSAKNIGAIGNSLRENMRITAPGNVGIGKTNPGYALDVTGDINFTGTFRQNGTAYVGSQWTGTSTLYFAGNVGIGATTSPSYPLDVSGIVRAGSTLGSSIYLTNSEVKWRGDGTAHFSIFNQNSTFQIRNTSANAEPGTAGSNLITINTTGNIGIGTTTNINSPLTVYKASSSATYTGTTAWGNLHLMPQGNDNAWSGISFGGSGGGTIQQSTQASITVDSNNANGTKMRFNVGYLFANGALERMTIIGETGNVGIGTASPSQPLDVNGAARVRGNIYNSDGTQGYVQMNTGITTIPGYLAFYKADNTRVGYIGWQYDSVNLVLQVENGYTGYVVNSKLGVKVAPGSYDLQVAGTIGASGDITALYSDERLKTKTGTLTGALDKVCSLDTFTYRNNELAQSFGFKDDYQRVGVSAQQVQKVLPEAVRPAPFDAENQSGQNYLTVQYEKLVPLLIEALKEERHLRCQLEERVRALEEGR